MTKTTASGGAGSERIKTIFGRPNENYQGAKAASSSAASNAPSVSPMAPVDNSFLDDDTDPLEHYAMMEEPSPTQLLQNRLDRASERNVIPSGRKGQAMKYTAHVTEDGTHHCFVDMPGLRHADYQQHPEFITSDNKHPVVMIPENTFENISEWDRIQPRIMKVISANWRIPARVHIRPQVGSKGRIYKLLDDIEQRLRGMNLPQENRKEAIRETLMSGTVSEYEDYEENILQYAGQQKIKAIAAEINEDTRRYDMYDQHAIRIKQADKLKMIADIIDNLKKTDRKNYHNDIDRVVEEMDKRLQDG